MRFIVSSNAIISNLAVKKKTNMVSCGKPPSQLKNSAFPSLLLNED